MTSFTAKPSVLDLSNGAKDTYSVDGRCLNCGWKGRVRIERGCLAPRKHRFYDTAECRYCGCREVVTVDA